MLGWSDPTGARAEPSNTQPGESSDGLAQITVSAERRPADIQDVPLGISVVTAADFKSLALRDSTDLNAAVPGLQMSKQGLGGVAFIRGVGTPSGAIGNESPVSLYVDGVYYLTPNTSIFSLDGIRQVEVLKGPQGTLFGRNATGGVIQVETEDPKPDPSARIQVQYGNHEDVRGSVFANFGVGASSAANVSLYGRDQSQGWGRNLETGVETFRHQEVGGRAKFLWSPSEQTRLQLAANYVRRSGEEGLGYHIVPGSLGIDGQTRYSGFYNAWADPQDSAHYRHAVLSARFEQDLPALRLVNILSWQTMHGFFNLDQDMTPQRIVQAPISQYGRTVTEELQAMSLPDASLSWIVGAFYLNDLSAYDPLELLGAAALPFDTIVVQSRQHSSSYALFGQTTASLSARTRLTAGARYTRDARRVEGETGAIVQGSSLALTAARQSADWKKPSWRLALDTDVAPDVMAYLSWDRGFKSGLYNLLTYAQPPVNPEELDAYQAGVKSEWFHNHLRLNLSAFVYEYRNIQVEEIVAGAVMSMNAAAARMRGFDLDLEYSPSAAFSLRAAAAFLHGRYTDFKDAPSNVPARNAAGELAGGNTVTSIDAAGLQTVRSPKRTLSLNGLYKLPTDIGEIGFGGGYYYNSGFAWDPDNRLRQRAFDLVSVSVDWTSNDGRNSVRAAASNLGDAEVCLTANASAVGDLCSPLAPRTLSIEWVMNL
ncbi:MAG: TonB-dependent receptor [Pseudomonadota bacterium]